MWNNQLHFDIESSLTYLQFFTKAELRCNLEIGRITLNSGNPGELGYTTISQRTMDYLINEGPGRQAGLPDGYGHIYRLKAFCF